MKKYQGFTLVEILIVIIIAGILLGIMMNLGWGYLRRLNYQQDREKYMSTINEFIMRGRTTNYYEDEKYSYFDITINTGSVLVYYGTGKVEDASCGTGNLLRNIVFEKSTFEELSGLYLPYTFRVEPYALGCRSYCSASGSNYTGTIKSKSLISDDEACFLFDGYLCKFNKVLCP